MRQRPHLYAFVGTYVPRQCGIATFTSDLCYSLAAQCHDADVIVVAINDTPAGYSYPYEVRYTIDEQDDHAYQRAADYLNSLGVDVVCLQHEFGIFGGVAGRHVLTLLRDVNVPIITTLHTVLSAPDSLQQETLEEIVHLSARLIVMSERASAYLQQQFAVPAEKIVIIPHGVSPVTSVSVPQRDCDHGARATSTQRVLLSYGFLSSNKGFENVISALPAILERHPQVTYHLVGVTHPKIEQREGQAYRRMLEQLASHHGVADHVVFVDRYLPPEQLRLQLQAADICLTPYLNQEQVVSGTLANMLGAGKPIISTPYWYAVDVVGNECGILVPFNDPESIARSVSALLDDDTTRQLFADRAFQRGQDMHWPVVAHRYAAVFQQLEGTSSRVSRKVQLPASTVPEMSRLPAFNLGHLSAMTDETGLLEHAIYTTPRYVSGYTTDDNARALLLAVLLLPDESIPSPDAHLLAQRYLAFLQYAFNWKRLRFRNRLSYARRWMDATGSEDCHGRALWALGALLGRTRNRSLARAAMPLFRAALRAVPSLEFPRPQAYAVLGLHAYLERFPGDKVATHLQHSVLQRLFGAYEDHRTDDWCWFGPSLTYDNAVLAHALIVGGQGIGRADIVVAGIEALTWLTAVQHRGTDHFVPVGCKGFYPKHGLCARYDQQPIEAQATVAACLAALRATGAERWLVEAHTAFAWFLGQNDLSLMLYDADTGGCHDGLQADRINQNEGAESTLAFLLSLAWLRADLRGKNSRTDSDIAASDRRMNEGIQAPQARQAHSAVHAVALEVRRT